MVNTPRTGPRAGATRFARASRSLERVRPKDLMCWFGGIRRRIWDIDFDFGWTYLQYPREAEGASTDYWGDVRARQLQAYRRSQHRRRFRVFSEHLEHRRLEQVRRDRPVGRAAARFAAERHRRLAVGGR